LSKEVDDIKLKLILWKHDILDCRIDLWKHDI